MKLPKNRIDLTTCYYHVIYLLWLCGVRTYFVEYQFPVVATSRDKQQPNAMATEVMRVVSKKVSDACKCILMVLVPTVYLQFNVFCCIVVDLMLPYQGRSCIFST